MFAILNGIKPEIKNEKISPNSWQLTNAHLNIPWAKEEIYIEPNKNEYTTYNNFEDMVKVVLKGKVTALNTYIRKERSFQVNNISIHLENPEK